jgi:hypothetical protein
MSNEMNRRNFLKSAAVLAVAATLPNFTVADGVITSRLGDVRIHSWDYGNESAVAVKRGHLRKAVGFAKPKSELTDEDISGALRIIDDWMNTA